jgi:cytoskeleton protein RodZ
MEADSYSEIGTLLRVAREERNLTREQVSHMLHIRLRYVEALEQGRLSELPGVAYTRGYLQAYAMFLGLDKDEILRRFEQVEGLLSQRGFYFPQAFSKEKSPPALFVWGGIGAAVTVYLLWLVLLQTPTAPVSIVDKFPENKPNPGRLSAQAAMDVACLKPQDVLYPPCTAATPSAPGLLPLPRQMESVLDLANIKAKK